MKLLRYIASLALSLFVSTFSFADGSLNPGWYVGVIGGGGTMGSLSFPATRLSFETFDIGFSSGKADFGLLGDIGFQIGYRYCNFRFEGEFLFGGGNFRKFDLFEDTEAGLFTIPAGSYRFDTPYTFGPPLPPNIAFFEVKYRRLFFAGFANLIYDFYPYNREVRFVPYAGLGIGALRIQDELILIYSDISPISVSARAKTSYSAPLAQAILGVTYLMDDFSNLGLDFRYMMSNPISQLADNRIKIYTVNLVFNYTLDGI